MEASTTERMIKSPVSARSPIMVFMMAEGVDSPDFRALINAYQTMQAAIREVKKARRARRIAGGEYVPRATKNRYCVE